MFHLQSDFEVIGGVIIKRPQRRPRHEKPVKEKRPRGRLRIPLQVQEKRPSGPPRMVMETVEKKPVWKGVRHAQRII